MTELVKIRKTEDGSQAVSARDLLTVLTGGDLSHFTKWATANLIRNEFAIEGVDYQGIRTKGENGRVLEDYALTIDFAKRLSMMAKTSKGEEVRTYFIECERIAKAPKSRLELAKENVLLIEEIEEKEKQLQAAKPAIDFYSSVADSKTAIPIGDAAKVLNCGIGQNNLFKFLRESKILMPDNKPYQEYIDRGYFRVIESKFTKPSNEVCISFKTLVYQKGLQYIKKLLDKKQAA